MVRDAEGGRRDDDDGETTVSDIKEEKEKRWMQDMEKQECICLVFKFKKKYTPKHGPS